MQIGIHRPRIGQALRVLIGIALLLAVLGMICTAPAPHDVRSSGGASIPTQLLPPFSGPPFDQTVTPTTSLADLRCQIWRHDFGPTCPDAETLESRIWPGFVPYKRAVFVGLVSPCRQANVEYVSARRALVFHCVDAAPWISAAFLFPPYRDYQTGSGFVMASTEQIGAGTLKLERDDRTEHWIADQSSVYPIGSVTVS